MLGLATKTINGQRKTYSPADEGELIFIGFLLFFDPPKADVRQTIVDLAKRGVQIKIITGDNRQGAAEDKSRGRLHGRRHQRRAGPACRGRRHRSGYSGGCGQRCR